MEPPTSESEAPRLGDGDAIALPAQLEAKGQVAVPDQAVCLSAASFTSTPSTRVPFRLPRSLSQTLDLGWTRRFPWIPVGNEDLAMKARHRAVAETEIVQRVAPNLDQVHL